MHWSLATRELGRLRAFQRGIGEPVVAMELVPPPDLAGVDALLHAWRLMRSHPNVVELLDIEGHTAILKFAAIDWSPSAGNGDRVAYALALARVFEHVMSTVSPDDWHRFLNPCVLFDLLDQVRVVWQPVTPRMRGFLAPELVFERPRDRSRWRQRSPAPPADHRTTERTFVYVLGRLMQQLDAVAVRRVAMLANKCTAKAPEDRIATIGDVRSILMTMAAPPPPAPPAWDVVEQGIGWLELGDPARARTCFEAALERELDSPLAQAGLHMVAAEAPPTIEAAKQLEADGRWADALAMHRRLRYATLPADYLVALARCHERLVARELARAFALRAAALDPDHLEAARLVVITSRPDETLHACAELARLAPRQAVEILDQVLARSIGRGHRRETERALELLAELATRDDPLAAHATRALGEAAQRFANISDLPHALAICERLHGLSPDLAERTMVAVAKLARRAWIPDPEAICRRIAAISTHAAIEVYLGAVETAAHRGEVSTAAGFAERLLALSPQAAFDAYLGIVEAAFHNGDPSTALALADQLVALAPTSGAAHYRRGRCLFGLRRLAEARDALERAQALEPTLIDAMLLRREVDRAIHAVQASTGIAVIPPPIVPDHLPEVRAALARGSTDDAIAWLESHPLGDSARLLLGLLLLGKQRYGDAVAAFDAVSGELRYDALVGKARALAAADRCEEALRLLDRVCAERPELGEAVVVRAKVVGMLRAAELQGRSRSGRDRRVL